MKIRLTTTNILTLFAVFVAAIFLAGCAETQATNTKSLLSASGFHVKTPSTPLQKEVYASLTPYQVQRATYKGKTFYVFKDEKEGVAYVGREENYQQYKRLCIQQQVAQNYYMAAQMDNAWSYRWYGAWGPRGYWY